MGKGINSYSKIKIKYAKPIDERLHVDDLDVLISDTTKPRYINQVVFVKSEKSLYYLKDGLDGDIITDWQAWELYDIIFPEYDSVATYVKGQPVSVSSLMFISTDIIDIGEDPINNADKWVQVGATSYATYSFVNQTEFTFDHAIPSAIAQVYNDSGELVLCDITKVSPTQFKITLNPEMSGILIIK